MITDSELSRAFYFCKPDVGSLSDLVALVVPKLADDLENGRVYFVGAYLADSGETMLSSLGVWLLKLFH